MLRDVVPRLCSALKPGFLYKEIFVFLSGMGLYYSFSKDSNVKKFYIKRYKRILIPYVIVAIAFWGIKDLLILEC